jgi:hypothetical protein
MNQRTCLLAFVVAASFLLTTPASAGVLYDNGPINGQDTGMGSWSISYGNIMSDSFTLTGTSTLTGVNLGIWVHPGDTPSYLKWRITDSVPDPGLGAIGTTADLTNTLWCSAGSSGCASAYDVYASSFSLAVPLPAEGTEAGLVLGPGTYYLTLDFGVSAAFDSLFWDTNDGPSVAFRNGVNVANYLGAYPGSNSDSFQILGDGPSPTGTPEPASTAMLISGLALVAGLARRRIRG